MKARDGRALEEVVGEAIRLSGVEIASQSGNPGFDFAVRSEDLEPWVSNPLFIEVQSSIPSEAAMQGLVLNLVRTMQGAGGLGKIEHRGLDFGLLLAMSGVTGDAQDKGQAHYEVAMALPKKIRIVVITREEIEALATTEELVTQIRRKVCQLALAGTLWP